MEYFETTTPPGGLPVHLDYILLPAYNPRGGVEYTTALKRIRTMGPTRSNYPELPDLRSFTFTHEAETLTTPNPRDGEFVAHFLPATRPELDIDHAWTMILSTNGTTLMGIQTSFNTQPNNEEVPTTEVAQSQDMANDVDPSYFPSTARILEWAATSSPDPFIHRPPENTTPVTRRPGCPKPQTLFYRTIDSPNEQGTTPWSYLLGVTNANPIMKATSQGKIAGTPIRVIPIDRFSMDHRSTYQRVTIRNFTWTTLAENPSYQVSNCKPETNFVDKIIRLKMR